ncbi:class I SAM-dependent methyltransferase [Nocardioides mangrovicus]|uniref:Class I SAM-dependent methyltransferase n=1 Tax=Nocardioides mangrovicus TaxID=2478913 RepID=A0A3L8P0S4_9ACTN|nr:class I SAM-dependent methyltransferase [Nocardioides mangrovicus]RLV48621.1 class I SAM-dependent methyltransferase [Nocardioides mangrovicus]
MQCRLCGAEDLRSVVDLGATPPCESFLMPGQLDLPETTYPLHLRVCADCLLLQIPALITPAETFTEYAYHSSYSDSWVQHARTFVDDATRRAGLGADSFVVEVASNDGYLLQHVVADQVRCLGIEPSVNVSAEARKVGVPTLTEFLSEEVAATVRAEHGPADLVVANNVYAHIPDLIGFTRALRDLVADDGWVSIEVHHALHLMEHAQFDTIYHEHFQYYTVLTAQRALATGGLRLVDVEELSTHGGSIRLWARPEELGAPVAPAVAEVIAREAGVGLDTVEGHLGLADRVARIRRDLVAFLVECARDGVRVAGYGAPGKGNTLLNFCGIRPDLLPYLVDRNPYKHGRFTPGTRIPIHHPDVIDTLRPEVIVVLPWNLKTEIDAQLAHTAEWGARLVYPLPQLTVEKAGTIGVER